MPRRALITGITGQDGSYLARFLLDRGYEVHGMVRRQSNPRNERLEALADRITLHQADLLDQLSIVTMLREVQPHEVYNLAAQTFVPTSFLQPVLTAEFTALGVLRVLEAIRLVDPTIRFYQASSSEMFGHVREEPQNEQTPFWPRSPYGAAKAYGHWITVNYRESYGLFACSGIMFNHESPQRGMEFVTPQSDRRRRPDQTWPPAKTAVGQSRRRARLGLCRRLCGSHVDDAAAGRARRLRHRDRHQAFGARVGRTGVSPRGARLARARHDRSAPVSAGRREHALWRRQPRPEPRSAGSPAFRLPNWWK